MKSKILKENAQPLGNYPHVKRVGDFIYVSGTSSRRKDNTHVGAKQDSNGNWVLDIREQTKAVIQNIEVLLTDQGALVYKVYTNGHGEDTSLAWCQFFCWILEKGYVPAIICCSNLPNPTIFGILRRYVSYEVVNVL